MKNHYGQIYKIENLINHKVYIGMTIQEDVLRDRYCCNVLKHTNSDRLRKSIEHYGWNNFIIEVLCYAENRAELKEKEREWIAYYNATDEDCGFNIDAGGLSGKMTDKGRKRQQQGIKEYWSRSENHYRMSNRQRGDNNPLRKKGGHSIETRKKLSQIRKEQIRNGIFDMKAIAQASRNPKSTRERVISSSKYWFIQYDLLGRELNRWHTLKDMYDYLNTQGIETHYKNYNSFKLKQSQKRVFEDHCYKDNGFIIKKINKKQNMAS